MLGSRVYRSKRVDGNLLTTDVLVVGGGNAALCAAISACQLGVRVLVVEKAPEEHRGGNSSLTLNMRFSYDRTEELIQLIRNPTKAEIELISDGRPCYTKEEYYDDLMLVTNGKSDPAMASILASESGETIRWLHTLGHTWVVNHTPLAGSLPLNIDGDGFGLQQRAFSIAETLGASFLYNARALDMIQDAKRNVRGVRVATPNGVVNCVAKAVVLACGGFEASSAMRARYLGDKWAKVKPRGVPFNTGDGLDMALTLGATPYGSWSSCHAAPQDVTLPDFMLPKDHKQCFQQWRYSFPFGITVNNRGERFFDEGESYGSLTYAKVGRAILEQRQSIAFQIFDAKARQMKLIRPAYENATRSEASTLGELAVILGIDQNSLTSTIQEYNRAVSPSEFMPHTLDGKRTIGLAIPKSNWALPIDTPPFSAYPVVCGITFTFGGLKIDDSARVLHETGNPISGLYAAGEIVGGLFHLNYPGGSGMMSGAVFGRKAGNNAARFARAMK